MNTKQVSDNFNIKRTLLPFSYPVHTRFLSGS